jgi:hypothetical protein
MNLAGWWLYRRSRILLINSCEIPSMSIVQCHILATMYLRNATLFNSAHKMVQSALGNAHVLGLHHNPPRTMSNKEKNLRARMFWSMYFLDSDLSLRLGRPPAIRLDDITIETPSGISPEGTPWDDAHASQILNHNGFSWLNYQFHTERLVFRIRAVCSSFYDKASELMSSSTSSSIYDNPMRLEEAAKSLQQNMKSVHEWTNTVPDQLKLHRRNSPEAFSTSRIPLSIDHYAPLWLQRQCVIVELYYHNWCTLLYRPFLRFSTRLKMLTPVASSHAATCINHAIATTYIIEQVLRETDILTNWPQGYHCQFDAVIVLLGFCLYNPACVKRPAAEKAIAIGIENFKLFAAQGIGAAGKSAMWTEEFRKKLDSIVNGFREACEPFTLREDAAMHDECGINHADVKDGIISPPPPPPPSSSPPLHPYDSGSISRWANSMGRDEPVAAPSQEFSMPLLDFNQTAFDDFTSLPAMSVDEQRQMDMFSTFDMSWASEYGLSDMTM